jgi:lysophospholipase L1-like esterase
VEAEVAAAFRGAGVPFVSFDRDPALLSEHFLDLDHLTAAGNRALAQRLAAELAPRAGRLAR